MLLSLVLDETHILLVDVCDLVQKEEKYLLIREVTLKLHRNGGGGRKGRVEAREEVTEIKDWFYLTIKPELSQNHCKIWLMFIDYLL